MVWNRCFALGRSKVQSRRRKIGMWILFILATAYGFYWLSVPPSVSGQPTQPTREYIYLDGKAVAVEE